jgi:tRNA threonylcarbamoyladenosine biosynthesis protein TsaB
VATYARQQSAQAGEIVALLDARMSEFNLGRYRLDDSRQIVALEADRLVSSAQAIELIASNQRVSVIGDAGGMFESTPELKSQFTPIYPNAIDILPLAQTEYSAQRAVAIETVDLVYLRGTEAWQKRKRLRTITEEVN